MMRRFAEKTVWESGVFTVDNGGRIWRDGKRAERHTGSGYLQVRVMRGGVRYYTTAHRLVWHATMGPIPEGMVVNHKNGIKDDNRPENLEVVSYSENTKHAYRTGLKDQHGEMNPAAKLTDPQVESIRKLYATGQYTMDQIGKMFGVRFQHVSRIVRGQRRPLQGGPVAPEDLRVREFPEVAHA